MNCDLNFRKISVIRRKGLLNSHADIETDEQISLNSNTVNAEGCVYIYIKKTDELK